MTVDAELLELMPDTVTWYVIGDRDGYGKPTVPGTGTALRARVVRKLVEIRTAEGIVTASRIVAWLASAPGVQPEDRVVLPDGTSPPILAVERYTDEAGANHEKLVFQ